MFNKILESFDTDFDKQWKHTGTEFNKVTVTNRDDYGGDDIEIGKEYSNSYELETYLKDGSQLKIAAYFSYCDLNEEEDHYIDYYFDDILYVGFEVYYGKKKIPNVYTSEERSKLDPEEYDLSAKWKSSPYSSFKKTYEDKLKDAEEKIKTLNQNNPRDQVTYETLKSKIDFYKRMLSLPAYSHANVANIIIGAIANLTKKMSQKYDIVVFDYYNEHNKQKAENLVNKIAKKCGFYPMDISIDYDIRQAIRFADKLGLEYFNISGDSGWFKNVSKLSPLERLELKSKKDEIF